MDRLRDTVFLLFLCLPYIADAADDKSTVLVSPAAEAVDEHTLIGSRNFLSGYQAVNADGTVNMVVEIPAGSISKWAVARGGGTLVRKFKKDKPRVVKYLAYPANYGMIPRTLLPKERGGDGDPLDIMLLGEALPRGAVVRTRIVGVISLDDKGEIDDKILAVVEGSKFAKVDDLPELREKFNGVLEILTIWFENYKGPGKVFARGYGDRQQAMEIVKGAADAYEKGSKAVKRKSVNP